MDGADETSQFTANQDGHQDDDDGGGDEVTSDGVGAGDVAGTVEDLEELARAMDDVEDKVTVAAAVKVVTEASAQKASRVTSANGRQTPADLRAPMRGEGELVLRK